jgi:hypothetical protein
MCVTFDDTEKKFVVDFEHDGAEDIVSLTGNGYQVKAFCNELVGFSGYHLATNQRKDKRGTPL